jgi:type II secretory pathway pseudopilin PulG
VPHLKGHRASALLLGVVSAVLLVGGCGGVDEAEREAAIAAARAVYEKERLAGRDFSRGPCLANPLPPPAENWVVDVAHEPRRAVDDEPANQCFAYREDRAEHFVELDPNGDLIRAE